MKKNSLSSPAVRGTNNIEVTLFDMLFILGKQASWGINSMHKYANLVNNGDGEVEFGSTDGREDSEYTHAGLLKISNTVFHQINAPRTLAAPWWIQRV